MVTETSQAYRIRLHERGTKSADKIRRNLQIEEIPKPQANTGQVLVRMKAASLNYPDLLVATDDPAHFCRTVDGLVPGVDGAGVIESVNTDSPWWRVGDRVIISGSSSWKSADPGSDGEMDPNTAIGNEDRDGILQQYMVVNQDSIYPVPDNLSFEEAASLGGSYGTAWNALFGGFRKLKAGDIVVSQGTGGVSTAVLQFATAAGAQVIGLASSAKKLEAAKRLGATHVLDSNDPEWDVKVLQLTDGRGADHVVDVVGSATIVRSLKACKKGGLVTVVGLQSSPEKFDLLPDILFGLKTVRGIIYASMPMLQDMSAFIQKHGIKPVLGRVFEWSEAPDAYVMLLSQHMTGKTAIKIA